MGAQERHGRVDLLFCNAGVIGLPAAGVLATPLPAW